MLTNSPSTHEASYRPFDGRRPRPPQDSLPSLLDGRHRLEEGRHQRADYDPATLDAIDSTVEISPADAVNRRTVTWDGMTAEIVQATRREKIECRFHAAR